MSNKENLLKDLIQAKENVGYLLNNANALVGMHGLSYWAERVEALRQAIKEQL